MEQFLIERPCQHIAVRRDGRLRFARTPPKRPAWMMLLWQEDHLTGWIDSKPIGDASRLPMMLGAIWDQQRVFDCENLWPLPQPRRLQVEAETWRRMPDLPYWLGAGKDFEVVEAPDLGDQANERALAFESFWGDVTGMLSLWGERGVTAADTASLATEMGFFVPVGPSTWDTMRREGFVSDLARHLARGRRLRQSRRRGD